MLKWLNESKRDELKLYYAFWKDLTPVQRKIYAAVKICLAPPGSVEYIIRGGKRSKNRPYESAVVQRELDQIAMAWRNLLAGIMRVPTSDFDFRMKSSFIEYGFIALLRDLTHGGRGFSTLDVPGWRISRLAMDLERLDRLVSKWLDENRPDPAKWRFSLWRS